MKISLTKTQMTLGIIISILTLAAAVVMAGRYIQKTDNVIEDVAIQEVTISLLKEDLHDVDNCMSSMATKSEERYDKLITLISGIKEEMGEIKVDVKSLKEDMATVREDLAVVKTEIKDD